MSPCITYANVVSSLALFLVLGGGAAYALDGSNTVFTDDIVNGEVKVADVGQGAVATDEIANGQVKTADIGAGEVRSGNVANDNLTGGDIAGNSLKAADIDESTLDIGDTARAYARVVPSSCTGFPETCTPEQSKGISSVTRDSGQPSGYCVTAPGIDSHEVPAAVTVDRDGTTFPWGNASAITREASACGPADIGFRVVTQRQPEIAVDAGGGTNNAIASGPAEPADDVAFTIVIP